MQEDIYRGPDPDLAPVAPGSPEVSVVTPPSGTTVGIAGRPESVHAARVGARRSHFGGGSHRHQSALADNPLLSGIAQSRRSPIPSFSMAPKHARSASDAPMLQASDCSLSNLWRMVKTHGTDWAVQKLSEGPEKNQQSGQATLLLKQQRKAPARSRDYSSGPGATCSTQPKGAAT
ncbi:hypothetical protein NDU88_005661 [Pleurodeles waltl]|uniref:Uncharacterized protein n=1 Tax=Pleurodeles waltl TaxID=8319 RepID=A0AAV7UIS2_PLEWA|nr:hypothetical protein NDU88_005661 [Pleurodeles waltl]